MKTAARAAATLTGAALIAALAACGAPQPTGPAVSTLTMNAPGYALSGNWNPATSQALNLYNAVQQAVYETFIELDPTTFEWEPVLAEDYVISEDRRSMRITLRDDVDFTDGTHLDAEAAKRAFDSAVAAPAHAVLQSQFAPSIEVTGEYELVVTSSGAMGTDFLFWFGIVPIASPTAIEEDPEGLAAVPVGTGPYILAEQVPDVSVTFERNPDFRDPDAFPFDEVEFLVFDDLVAASNALKTGRLTAVETAPEYAADLESSGFALHTGVGAHGVLIWSDPHGEVVRALADVRVRQAIAFAIDRAAIVESIEYGYGTVTSQAWGKGSPYYLEGADDTYAYDVERARDLLAEAGYPDGFEFTMAMLPPKYEPFFTQSLADIGITVTYDVFSDPAEATAAVNEGRYALAYWSTSDLFLSDPLRRIPRGGIPELLERYEIIDTGTIQEAAAATREIAQFVLDDAIAIALSRPAQLVATVPEITVDMPVVRWPVPLRGFHVTD